ncbi:CRAL/TRIO domain-containing protein [Lactarius psammicola]|nr:CRAL/TRIO domain-containing protein [Lactarius psammicola]
MAANSVAESVNGNASVVDYTAYPPPLPTNEKPAPAELSAAQAEMHKKVLEHFRNEAYIIPGIENGGLLEEEKFWLSNDCMLRYLRATKWNSARAAIERLEGTLKWRREFGIYNLSADLVEPEAVTGKEVVFGYDTLRRPALYMIPSRQNTEESPRQIQYTFWVLERALELTGPGVESVVLMINFADKAKNPSLGTAKLVLNILQTHYPERLGTSLILNVPFIIQAFFKIISPFIDPITRNKMKFNPKPVENGLFDADELFKDGGWGGSRNFVWDHEKYWRSFVEMCAEIKAKQMARWRKLGARVGCDEWDYKSEDVVDISPAVVDASPDAAPAPEPRADAMADKPPNGVGPSAEPLASATDNSPAGSDDPDDAPLDDADTEVVNMATAV